MKKNHIYSLTFLGILILIISCKDDDENSLIVNCDTVSISQTKEMPGIVGYDVIQTTDCNYLITGISDNGSTLLTKIDGLGNELWSTSFDEISGNSWGKSISRTNDGGYIIGANENTIIKSDKDGNLEWVKKLNYSVNHFVEDVIQTKNGDFIVVGGTGGDPLTPSQIKGQAFVLKLSQEGNEIHWVKRYGISNTPNDNFWGIVESDDGGFVLVGEKLQDRNFEFYDHFWIMKIDDSGNEVWSKELGDQFWDEAQDIIKLSDGSYIIAGKSFPSKTQGNLWVMKISQSGEIVWESQHNGGRTRNSPISISVSKDETSVFIAGYGRLPNNKENYILWSLNPITGEVLWDKAYGGSLEDKGYGITNSFNNGTVIVGRSKSYSSNTKDTNWLVITDSSGNL